MKSASFFVRNVVITLLALQMATGSLQEFFRVTPLYVAGSYGLRNIFAPQVGWPAPGDILDNVLIWLVATFLLTCWVKRLASE
jgi:hypothetical protein